MSTMSKTLDPQTLEQLLALMQGGSSNNNGVQQWSGAGGLSDWTVDRRRDIIDGGTEASGPTYGDPITRLYQNTGHETWGQDTADVFDEKGQFIGGSSGDSEALALAKFIAMSVGGYYAAGAANGMMGAGAGAGAGAGGAGSMSTMEAMAMLEANGLTAAEAAAVVGGNAAGTATVGAGTVSGMSSAAGTLTAEQVAQQAAQKAAAQKLLNNGGNVVDTGKLLATAAGAVAGAADSGDKTQTTNRDPWGPAQPYLKGLLEEGSDLYGKYKAQPFSAAQQAGYANQGQLLDLINSNAGGLLSGFQANAMGTNQFRRGQPQQGLIGSSFAPRDDQWNPHKYGSFGTYKG